MEDLVARRFKCSAEHIAVREHAVALPVRVTLTPLLQISREKKFRCPDGTSTVGEAATEEARAPMEEMVRGHASEERRRGETRRPASAMEPTTLLELMLLAASL